MAETVTWPLLRELANFRAEKGCAVSLYLNLDPSEVPTAGDAQSRMNALLNEAEKKDRKDLTHEQRRGVLADFERIARWFDDEFDRAGSRALAVFAAGLDNYWSPMQLVQPVPDIVKVGRDFYLAPLAPAVARADGTIIAVVGREQGQLFRLRAGRLEEIAEHFDEQPGRHDQGGWSQARYQRHIEKLVQDHLKGVAEELDRSRRRLQSPKVVLVCSEEMRAEFTEELPASARAALIGWAPTLEAASDGRVDLLLFQEGSDRPAWRCPACGRAGTSDGSCPLDGTRLEPVDGGLDLAVHQTLAHGGAVWAIRHHPDLAPVEGIGALLRY